VAAIYLLKLNPICISRILSISKMAPCLA
jgi:hypothetical protein